MPAIRACLEHRHSYVRRNAVLAIYTIYRLVTAKNIEFCHNIHMEQARNALLDTYFYHLSVSSRKCGNRYRHG